VKQRKTLNCFSERLKTFAVAGSQLFKFKEKVTRKFSQCVKIKATAYADRSCQFATNLTNVSSRKVPYAPQQDEQRQTLIFCSRLPATRKNWTQLFVIAQSLNSSLPIQREKQTTGIRRTCLIYIVAELKVSKISQEYFPKPLIIISPPQPPLARRFTMHRIPNTPRDNPAATTLPPTSKRPLLLQFHPVRATIGFQTEHSQEFLKYLTETKQTIQILKL
jgi:hypothetical protein